MTTLLKLIAPAVWLCLAAQPGLADDSTQLKGIDLSHHNPVSDWAALKADGISIVILKATDGETYLDPTFVTRFSSAQNHGFIRGAYHFYETNDSAQVQAEWFIKNVKLLPGDLPPIVDIERVKKPVHNTLSGEFGLFLQALENHYGRKPIIYTGPSFWNHVMKEHLPSYPLWLAQYGTAKPKIPDGWADWILWQYSQSLSVTGVNGTVDGSYFNGGMNNLRHLLLPDDK